MVNAERQNGSTQTGSTAERQNARQNASHQNTRAERKAERWEGQNATSRTPAPQNAIG